jgi:multiple sugar transport system ATP-binding protein
MGRALAREPEIFLFDEPLSNLDAKLRVDMRTEIKELHQRTGTTIVYVTHDQIEAMTLGERIAVMHRGVIQQFGTPREIYDNPANLFVAGFIGSPSMNFIPCTLEEQKGVVGVQLESAVARKFFCLPDEFQRLRSQLGRKLSLGIRPEQITDVEEGKSSVDAAQTISCVVDISEPPGPDTVIITHINNQKVVCRTHPDEAAAQGEQMALMFNMSKSVLFDPDTEQRID